LVALSGCAFTKANVKLAYLTDPAKKSPLSALTPMTLFLQLEDLRKMKNSKQVGNKRNSYNMITAQVESEKDVLKIFRDALKNEFNNNGVNVVDSKGSSSDAIVRVGLKKYWSDVRIKFWEIVMIGTVDADITIRDPKNNSDQISRSINGTFRESRQIAVDEAYESVLNGALAEFVRNFSRDPSILKALRLAKRRTETTGESKPVAASSKAPKPSAPNRNQPAAEAKGSAAEGKSTQIPSSQKAKEKEPPPFKKLHPFRLPPNHR